METRQDVRGDGLPELRLQQLYGKAGAKAARDRCEDLKRRFEEAFGAQPEAIFSAPGRTELGGNHTDHQHGRVLAAGINLDLLAAVKTNRSGMIRLQSQGYSPVEVALDRLTPVPEERYTSAALLRGVAARMAELGCPLAGVGMDVFVVSDVPAGSGLSSSAAFEVLMATAINALFWEGKCSAVELAQIGQYAENVFFGKPCGLMDQTASAVGGVVAIDFADPQHPLVEQVELDLNAQGYALCILDSGADHADLTEEYAAITQELHAVSAYFGKSVLRDVPEQEFFAALGALRSAAGDRAVLRAMHVYAENRRAAQETEALQNGNFAEFLSLVRQSGKSSAMYLQNVVPGGCVKQQELLVAIALCETILGQQGAVRVHGGGFGGTVQAFVPLAMLETFRKQTEAVLGQGSCHVLTIRPVGSVRVM